MKIIIIHYRYYQVSGPEIYLFNVSKLLEEKGHIVIPFSLKYQSNVQTSFNNYFADPVITEFHIHRNANKISIHNKLRIIKNSFYNTEVYRKLSILIKIEKPDLVYVLQYASKLSVSIFDACNDNNVPVILRLSDFNLVCAKNILFRNGNICIKCINNKLYGVKYRCVHDSFSQSLVYYFVQKCNEIRHFENQINSFIVPSLFTISLLKSSNQFKNCNFYHIPSFINKEIDNNIIPKIFQYNLTKGLKLCCFGRVADDKGIDILIDSINVLKQKGTNVYLDIIGDNSSDYAIEQMLKVKNLNLSCIKFSGYLSNEEILNGLSNYHYSVIPSKVYDNMPNSLIESCLMGVPVIVSSHGSLLELVEDGFNGFTFEPNSYLSLATTIESLLLLDEKTYNSIANNAMHWVRDYCNRDNHYEKLMNAFNNAIHHEKNYQ